MLSVNNQEKENKSYVTSIMEYAVIRQIHPDPRQSTWYRINVAFDSFGRIPRLMKQLRSFFMIRAKDKELMQLCRG
jgi:hypothetical protein